MNFEIFQREILPPLMDFRTNRYHINSEPAAVFRILTSVPHLGGTPEDLSQAQWVREKFIEAGFDEATVVPYDVLLSYPDQEQPNKVYLLSEDGSVLFETSGTQTPIYAPEEGLPNIMPNFNAYSAQGEVEVSRPSLPSSDQRLPFFHLLLRHLGMAKLKKPAMIPGFIFHWFRRNASVSNPR